MRPAGGKPRHRIAGNGQCVFGGRDEMADGMPDHLVFVTHETLSDGSEVHNVVFGEFTFHAITESDADELANDIVRSIEAHTNDTADVVYE